MRVNLRWGMPTRERLLRLVAECDARGRPVPELRLVAFEIGRSQHELSRVVNQLVREGVLALIEIDGRRAPTMAARRVPN